MTLVMALPRNGQLTVVADTRLTGKGKSGVELAPKIYPVPITLYSPKLAEPRRCPPMGFAYAGHTAAGQMTHSLASAGLQALRSEDLPECPSLRDVADYFTRCAVRVAKEIRSHYPNDDSTFEAFVFGWESGRYAVYSFETRWRDGEPIADLDKVDFSRFSGYAIGKGHRIAQRYFDAQRDARREASLFDALQAVIDDESEPTVGGNIQAATATANGVELKVVLWAVDAETARGGFMGTNVAELGPIGNLIPIGSGPLGVKSSFEAAGMTFDIDGPDDTQDGYISLPGEAAS